MHIAYHAVGMDAGTAGLSYSHPERVKTVAKNEMNSPRFPLAEQRKKDKTIPSLHSNQQQTSINTLKRG